MRQAHLFCIISTYIAVATLLATHAVQAMPTGVDEKAMKAQCRKTTRCPEYPASIIFDIDGAHLIPESPLFLKEVSRPFVSPLFPIHVTTVVAKGKGKVSFGDTRYWQVRTVAAVDPKQQLVRHFLVPFLVSTGHPYVYIGETTTKKLQSGGATEHDAVMLAICNVNLGLPVSGNSSCARNFSPTKFTDSKDARKNIVGSVDASAIIAVSALVHAGVGRSAALGALERMFSHATAEAEIDELRAALANEFDLQRAIMTAVPPIVTAAEFLSGIDSYVSLVADSKPTDAGADSTAEAIIEPAEDDGW